MKNNKKNKIVIKYSLLIVLLMGFCNVRALSKCDSKEKSALNKEAVNIKVKYDIKEEKLVPPANEIPAEFKDDPEDYFFMVPYFKINILNLSDNFYITVKNKYSTDEKEQTINSSSNGIVSFDRKEIYNLANLSFNIYSSNKTSCPDELIKTISLSLPRYNSFSEYEICEKIPDFDLCQKFVMIPDRGITYKKFMEKAKNEVKKNEEKEETSKKPSFFEKLKNFLVRNYLYFIIGLVVIVIVAIVILIVIKYKHKNDKFRN